MAEKKVREDSYPNRGLGVKAFRETRVLITDIDGVWTDNTVYCDASGRETLRFHKGDSLGLRMLRMVKPRLRVIAVSMEANEICRKRFNKLHVEAHFNVFDKAKWAKDLKLDSAFCYVGNDVNDLPVMNVAYATACPQDSVSEVRKSADIICAAKGGWGAMREIFDIMLLKDDLTRNNPW